MNIQWYRDIAWFGSLFQFIGAFIGILEYIGAERIRSYAQRYNLRNSDQFLHLGPFKIRAHKEFTRLPRTIERLNSLLLTDRNFLFFSGGYSKKNILLTAILCVYLVANLWFGTSINQAISVLPANLEKIMALLNLLIVVWAWIRSSAFLIPLAFVLMYTVYFTVLFSFTYYAMVRIYLFLEKTAAIREHLIFWSIFLVLLGSALQVIGPIVQ